MSSPVGYPSFSPRQHGQPMTALSKITSTAMTAVLSTATFPWHVFLTWLSWCCGIAVRSFTSLGAPPPRGYLPADKLTELTSILNHMHSREDLYRRAIRELQEELDTKDSDRKKALKKLRSTKNEIEVLTEKLTELQTAYHSSITDEGHQGTEKENYIGTGGHYNRPSLSSKGSRSIGSVGVHATILFPAAAVWWFSQTDHAALHWKLVFSMFFPLLWAYVSWMASKNSTSTGGSSSNAGEGYKSKKESPLLVLCAAWFLVGFAIALSLGH